MSSVNSTARNSYPTASQFDSSPRGRWDHWLGWDPGTKAQPPSVPTSTIWASCSWLMVGWSRRWIHRSSPHNEGQENKAGLDTFKIKPLSSQMRVWIKWLESFMNLILVELWQALQYSAIRPFSLALSNKVWNKTNIFGRTYQSFFSSFNSFLLDRIYSGSGWKSLS